MTSISSTRVTSPAQRTQRPQPSQSPAQPADARAMGEALANARRQMPPAQPRGQAQMPRQGAAAMRDGTAGEMAAALTAAHAREEDAVLAQRFGQERDAGGEAGSGWMQAPAPLPTIPMPLMPNAAADPSGFAQMLADLWTRENGKGHREVQVRFGDGAWPATGARLVRNAAGTLDIALMVDNRARDYPDRLPSLQQHLADAGVALGQLRVEVEGA